MTGSVPLDIVLHDNQEAIHGSMATNIVVMAGKRFGKSKFACFKLTKWAFAETGQDGIFGYIAPTYAQAKNIAWGEFKRLIPRPLIKRIVENELSITLINDEVIRLFGADNIDSLRGIKFRAVVIDEAAYVDKYIWNNVIRGQLLGSLGQKPGRALFISSPLNPLKSLGKDKTDWYPEFYQEALRKKQTGDSSWDAYHFTIYDNPTLSKDQIDEIKADSTDDEWNVEYMAMPSAHAGHVYSEFDYERHVTELEVEQGSVLVRGLDWGIAHPTACLFVHVTPRKKEIFIKDEFSKSGCTIEENSETIRAMTGLMPVEWTVCDPSMAKRNSQTLRTDKQEFDRCGIYCVPGDNNDRGYNIVKMFLKKGHIKVSPKCRLLIKQLRELQWGQDINDDLADCLRYVCVRIHDLMFKWDKEEKDEEVKSPFVNKKEYNFNDSVIFPKKKAEAEQGEFARAVNDY